jgi:hypothetical protein
MKNRAVDPRVAARDMDCRELISVLGDEAADETESLLCIYEYDGSEAMSSQASEKQ